MSSTGHTGLRVAVVTESFLPSVNGVARSVAEIVGQLSQRDCEVLIVAPAPGSERFGDIPVQRVVSMPLPWCREFPVGMPGRTLSRALADFAPDVIHLASPIVLGARAAAIAADADLPAVAVYQTDVAGFATQYGLGRASPWLWRWLRRVHNQARRTLAPSRAAVADLRRHGVLEVHRWVRGVDTDAFNPRHRTRPPTGQVERVRVGYVGRLTAEKRVERLTALTDVDGIELVVVGDGSERNHLQAALPDAHFTGQLGGRELSQAYADLDLFVHTGAHETFCQAAQEALASGVPVLSPAAGGLLDLVRHGRTGLFWDPLDLTTLQHAVRRLTTDAPLRAWQSAAARAQVAGRGWSAITDELVGHYLDVLPPTRRQAALRSTALQGSVLRYTA